MGNKVFSPSKGYLPCAFMCAKSLQSCPTLCDPMDCSPPGSSVHGILQTRILEWVAILSPGDLPNPGIKPRSPTLQADSLPAELPRKPKNTCLGSLSLLQQIFPTQELNQGLLHCRQILYQLSYQGSHSELGVKPTATKKPHRPQPGGQAGWAQNLFTPLGPHPRDAAQVSEFLPPLFSWWLPSPWTRRPLLRSALSKGSQPARAAPPLGEVVTRGPVWVGVFVLQGTEVMGQREGGTQGCGGRQQVLTSRCGFASFDFSFVWRFVTHLHQPITFDLSETL